MFGEYGCWRIAKRKISQCCDSNAKKPNGEPHNFNCVKIINIGDRYYDTKEASQAPFATYKWCKSCAELNGYN